MRYDRLAATLLLALTAHAQAPLASTNPRYGVPAVNDLQAINSKPDAVPWSPCCGGPVLAAPTLGTHVPARVGRRWPVHLTYPLPYCTTNRRHEEQWVLLWRIGLATTPPLAWWPGPCGVGYLGTLSLEYVVDWAPNAELLFFATPGHFNEARPNTIGMGIPNDPALAGTTLVTQLELQHWVGPWLYEVPTGLAFTWAMSTRVLP